MPAELILVPQEACPIEAVLIPQHIRKTLCEHRQHERLQPEAGGMLLGYRRGPYLEVVDVTQPDQGDMRSPVRFVRKSIQHFSFAITRWKLSKGHIGHLGEWHTHPEYFPAPSSIDTQEWKRVTLATNESNLFLIQGSSSIYAVIVWLKDGSVVFSRLTEQ